MIDRTGPKHWRDARSHWTPANGEAVRKIRKSLGLSREKVGERGKFSMDNLARLERGLAKDPGIGTLRALASGLGVPLARLIAVIEDEDPTGIVIDEISTLRAQLDALEARVRLGKEAWR